MERKSPITRRGFVQLSSGALIVGGISNATTRSDFRASTPTNSDPVGASGKIALEEHFDFSGTEKSSYASFGGPEFQRQIKDLSSGRIAEMDRGGLEVCILSLVGPGIQAIPNSAQAVEVARRANDHLAENIAKNSKRLKGFAALAMQDPNAAAQELTRCIKELGFCGALVNGFSQTGDAGAITFYDMPQYRDFWATAQQLDAPFYLHPRSALPAHQPAYQGHPWLTGSIWGFTAETSIHALRLMGSGLFDDYPKLKIILGHLGEGLPCSIWRIDNRISRTLQDHPKAKQPIGQYLRENFYITTSGNFRTQTLIEVMLEVGADRILYSVDYPFEDVGLAADWFNRAAISDADRLKIGRSNAQQLFRL
ncbi:MAG TPA: amidohydrolase family protein [Candidatus Sulfotelmatobacter sp.]|jgi:2,3-dihydroxybenzoate decarboxylase|nr:amidohydrolase family protein [Candidatus Sulfotelmatobacter sp.]